LEVHKDAGFREVTQLLGHLIQFDAECIHLYPSEGRRIPIAELIPTPPPAAAAAAADEPGAPAPAPASASTDSKSTATADHKTASQPAAAKPDVPLWSMLCTPKPTSSPLLFYERGQLKREEAATKRVITVTYQPYPLKEVLHRLRVRFIRVTAC
jgi:hypothetical protein